MPRQRTNLPSYQSSPPSYQSIDPWASAPSVNGSGRSERDTLLPPSNSAPKHSPTTFPINATLIILASVLSAILGGLFQHATSTNIFDPAVRDQIRRQWDVTYAHHEQRLSQMHNITVAWGSEIEQHSEMRLTMAQERAQWDTERRAWKKVREEEVERQRQWDVTYTHHEQRLSQILNITAAWESEVERHGEMQLAMARERAQWDAERRAWEKVREEERMEEVERQRREREKEVEEEERQRAGIYWMELQRSEHCERYGTRKYWAKLGLVDAGYDRLKACQMTEMEINGRKMKPTYCEDTGTYHGVWGNWIVDFDEGGCRPWWEGFTDKGCTAPGSGLRRIDAHLINLDHADGWNVMCSSTPADFNGLHFNGAMSCINGYTGVFGVWDIDDGKCL